MFTCLPMNYDNKQGLATVLVEGRAGPLSGPEFTHPVVYLLGQGATRISYFTR